MDLCSICRENFDSSSAIVIAKHCSDKSLEESRKRGHYFHRSCIETWKKHCCITYDSQDLSVGFICPMDRDEIARLYTTANSDIIGFDIKYYDSDLLKVLQECKTNKHLLQQIENINEVDKRNKSLAYYACYLGDYQVVSRLLTKGADFHMNVGMGGFTPFMAAVCQNHYNIVLKLFSSKVLRIKINTTDIKGMTGFMYACKLGHTRIITAFLNDKIPTMHEVRYCLSLYRREFDEDKLYGKEIIHKMTHYLKP